jgi:putative copper export protein
VLLFVCVALTGAYNWRRMLPALGDEAGARQIRRTASIELAIGAVVLAVTATLVVTPPPE